MKKKYCAIILVTLNFIPLFGQNNNCKDQILDYRDFIETDSTKWCLTLSKDDRIALFYFGAIHSKDPSNIQFNEIEKAWSREKFDIALYEGPNRGIFSTKEETIEKLGESGFLRFLASRDSVEVLSLEPDPIKEINYLLDYFPIEKIKLFFLLREAQRVRESFNWEEVQIKSHIENVLTKANSLPVLNNTVLNIRDIENSFIKYWGTGIKWWEAPSNWFDPLQASEKTGGIFTNDINRYSSNYRNTHMFDLITSFFHKNKRVFAIVGRNHIPMQSKALKCEWERLSANRN
ncbi:MAG TPA: hypothetical protein PLZ15_02700 [Melioribacteraceae bacterium]|nr:hypothetical protein [Melioribacteraceae bacterium]